MPDETLRAATPVIDGWFTTGDSPTLVGARCTLCATVWFPRRARDCPNPGCGGVDADADDLPLSRRGTVWSYTDARYQPPAPYIAPPGDYQPFGLAAVELPEGLVVLGQLAEGYGVTDVHVGSEVELVVETLYLDETGERSVWRWRPIAAEEDR